MARKPRIHIPGGFYHVILRGNDGQDIFFSDQDQNYFEKLVQNGIDRFKHRIHAFCWMSNHVHMLIQVYEVPLSKIIQNLSFRYTNYINKKIPRIQERGSGFAYLIIEFVMIISILQQGNRGFIYLVAFTIVEIGSGFDNLIIGITMIIFFPWQGNRGFIYLADSIT